jgi:hypothetical protein
VKGFLLSILTLLFLTACSPKTEQASETLPSSPISSSPTVQQSSTEILSTAAGKGEILVRAYFEGPDWSKEFSSTSDEHHQALTSFGLAEPARTYKNSNDFAKLLPQDGTKVGQQWKLEHGYVSRYLRQLHPDFTEDVLRDGAGSVAMLRARSDKYDEVLIRTHAEARPGNLAVFAPAQFEGRLIVDRENNEVAFFHLRVPTNRVKNLNYEFLSGEGGQVGMVFLPRMELAGGDASLLEYADWSKQVDLDQARYDLAKAFFEFEKIRWVKMEHAIELASKEDKPILAIVIEGVLDDQSC